MANGTENIAEYPAGSESKSQNGHTFKGLTETISGITERKTPPVWFVAFGAAVSLLLVLFGSIGFLVWEGVGIWGLNNPVGWGWAIINFVWWVGIGHAGTLISAILFLLRQRWRTSINRFAEAMTLFAVSCALIFPGIHVGRIWVAYWMFPIPNQMDMWPNFRSPLLWDVFAVGTYFTASLLFWYTGLIPDLATFRDRAKKKIKKIIFGIPPVIRQSRLWINVHFLNILSSKNWLQALISIYPDATHLKDFSENFCLARKEKNVMECNKGENLDICN